MGFIQYQALFSNWVLTMELVSLLLGKYNLESKLG